MKKIGILVLIIGLVGLVGTLAMDTTVASGSGRIHNIGRISEQQNLLLVSVAMAIVGVVILVFGYRNRESAQTNDVKGDGANRMFSVFHGKAELSNDAYKIFLTKKYGIERNEALGKIICSNKLFENIDEALKFAGGLYTKQIAEKEMASSYVIDKEGQAAYELGKRHFVGLGTAKDYVEAARLFAFAHERGISAATYDIGVMYESGLGFPVDTERALEYYLMAAQKGIFEAQRKLKGKGIAW